MAAPAENLLSLGYRTRTRENTFTKQREHCVKESREMHLQQRLQELKDREHQAQRHSKQLLQQFQKAQDTLEEMLARNAAMKTIRMEYERYLEENSPRWQQQLQEAAQKKRMEDCSRLYKKKSEEKEVLTSTVDGPLLSHDPSMLHQKCIASHENSDYHQSSFSHHPFSQLTSTQTHTGRFPGFPTVPHQSHSPFFFPTPNFLHPHSFLLQHPTSSLGQHQQWSKLGASGWDLGSWTAGIPPGSVGQLHTENPPPSSVPVREGNEMNTSKEKDDGGCLSPDLDVKPVRLSSSHAESSGSSGGFSLADRDRRKKKKRGRVQHSSSDSQKSSNKIINASSAAAQSSERNSSSEGSDRSSSTRRGEAPDGSPQPEGGAETRREEDEESQHSDEESSSSKKVENQSLDDKSESCRAEESGRDVENESRAEEETDNQEGSSDEERDDEGVMKDLETGDEENSQKSQEQVSDVEGDEDNEVSTGEKTREDVEHQEEQQSNKNKDIKIRKERSASSQDEEEDGSEEDEESNKEDRSEEAEDSCDSDDIIIPPPEKRSEQMQVIPEDDDDEVKTQSSDEDAIENLLAPPEGAKKAETDESADEEPKAVCHNMNIFQVMEAKSKVDRVSDSDEFDHFYD